MKLDTFSFNDAVDVSGVVFVKFSAAWCGPCKIYAPVFEKFAEENPDVKCYSVDCVESPELAEEHGIMSIPMTLVFVDGKFVKQRQGKLSSEQLSELAQK
jgi:thioredoxin 1